MSESHECVVTGVCWSKADKRWKAMISVNNKPYYLGCSKDMREAVEMRFAGEKKYGRPNRGPGWSKKYSKADMYLHPGKTVEQKQIETLKSGQPAEVFVHRCPVCHAVDDQVSKYKHYKINKGISLHFCHSCRVAIRFGSREPRDYTPYAICENCGKKFFYCKRKAGDTPNRCRKCQIRERIKLRALGERLETIEQNGKSDGSRYHGGVSTITNKFGCTLKRTKKINRCKKWGTCEHELECLCAVPEYWEGFISDCKGYQNEQKEWFADDESVQGTFLEEQPDGSIVCTL